MADENIKIGIDVSQVVSGAKQGADAIKQMGEQAKQSGKAMTDAMNTANMSLGELKRELREMRNLSFAGKTEDEIKRIRARMAELTDAIGDFQGQVRTASADRIPALINGLQGIVAVTQGVTATLGLFGVENQKLEKSMIQLIGAAQALNTIYDLYEKQTLKVAVATAKDTTAQIAKTIATKANTLATQANTVAMKALFTTIAANPLAALAITIGAVVTAIIAMNGEMSDAEKVAKGFSGAIKTMADNAGKEIGSLKMMEERINSANTTQAERVRLVDELQKKYPGYLTAMDREAILAGRGAEAFDKLAEAIRRKALAAALSDKVGELSVKLLDEQTKLAGIQTEIENTNGVLQRQKLTELQLLYKQTQQEISSLTLQMNVFSRVSVDQTKSTDTAAAAVGGFRKAFESLGEEVKKTEPEIRKEVKETNDELSFRAKLIRAAFEVQAAYVDALQKANVDEIDANTKINTQLLTRTKLNTELINAEIAADEARKARQAGLISIMGDISNVLTETLKYTQMAGDAVDNLQQIEMNRFKADQETQTQLLEEEYEKRLASAGANAFKKNQVDKWYSGEKERMEKETTDKSLEIEKKYRRQQQAIQVSQAIASAAQGILGAWVQASLTYPPPASAIIAGIQSALIAGVAATQIGVITSQKYEKGGTGVIEGKSHVSGGVKFFGGEAESDERWAIFNREATLRNTGLANLIDAVNGHQLIIDNNFMKRLNGDANNIVVMSNFNGGEHLAGMHEIMKRNEGRDIYLPDGRIKRGIIKRRYN